MIKWLFKKDKYCCPSCQFEIQDLKALGKARKRRPYQCHNCNAALYVSFLWEILDEFVWFILAPLLLITFFVIPWYFAVGFFVLIVLIGAKLLPQPIWIVKNYQGNEVPKRL